MVLEAAFLLQVEDEGPDLQVADLGGVGAGAVIGQEPFQVADAVMDDIDGVSTPALGGGEQGVEVQQPAQPCSA